MNGTYEGHWNKVLLKIVGLLNLLVIKDESIHGTLFLFFLLNSAFCHIFCPVMIYCMKIWIIAIVDFNNDIFVNKKKGLPYFLK